MADRRHTLVLCDRSRDAAGALREAARLTRAGGGALTVVALAGHQRQAIGCSVGANAWNREMDDLAQEELAAARAVLSEEHCTGHLMVAEGAGAAGLADVARTIGADLIVAPGHGLSGRRFARAVRRRTSAEVVVVARAAEEAPEPFTRSPGSNRRAHRNRSPRP